MLVTILTDASWCPQTKAAGWGAWIATDRGKKQTGGAFKSMVPCNTTAEVLAITHALYKAITNGLLFKNDTVLIQTDSIPAISLLSTTRRSSNQLEADSLFYFMNLCLDNNLTVHFKHVKAHTNREEARFKANTLCDAIAKNFMRTARKKLQNEANASKRTDKTTKFSSYGKRKVRRSARFN